MQLGTNEEINTAQDEINAAEVVLMKAKLRLRALKGEPLMQQGDSFPLQDMVQEMANLAQEFGSRNLRPI